MKDEDIPCAAEVPANPEDSYTNATQVFDTKKLHDRLQKCYTMSLLMVGIGLQRADNMDNHATLVGALGLILRSRHMQESSHESYRRANETRVYTICYASIFLLASVTATTLYWAVEEGMVGPIVKSVIASGRSCFNAITSAGSWIKKDNATNMVNSNNFVPSNVRVTQEKVIDQNLPWNNGWNNGMRFTTSANNNSNEQHSEEYKPEGRENSLLID